MPQAIGQAGFRVHATAAPKSCSVINVHLGVANHADLEAEVAERTAQVVLKGDSLGQQQLAMKAGGRLPIYREKSGHRTKGRNRSNWTHSGHA